MKPASMYMPPYADIKVMKKLGVDFNRKEGNDYHYTFCGEDGYGFMLVRTASPGVTVMYSEYRLSSCESGFDAKDDLLVLDFCREGRMDYESRSGNGHYSVGDLCINSRSDHAGTYRFPLSHYVGITISFDLRFLDENPSVRKLYPVDIRALRHKLLRQNERSIVRDDRFAARILSGFYDIPVGIRGEYYYHLVCELLLYLESIEPPRHVHIKPFVDRDNVNKVAAIRNYLVENLETHHTINELAERFDMPVTTLKACFRDVYGDPIFSYMRSYRANKAAVLMIEQPRLRIADIAVQVGYANPSKFSDAFKDVMGCLPSIYRKRHRAGGTPSAT